MKNNIEHISKSLKTKEFKVFVLFFVLSLFFWVVTKLSGNYTITIPVAVELQNIPNNKYVEQDTYSIKAEVETTGFKVLQQLFASPKIVIDLKNKLQQTDERYTVETSKLSSEINEEIGSLVKIKSITPSNLEINVVSFEEKKVPIQLNSSILFRTGYNLLNPIRISPDSIKVYGPKTIIDSIDVIRTTRFELEDTHEDFSQQVLLELEKKRLKYDIDIVTVYGDVDEFVYKELSIPVKVTNTPNNKELTIFPKEITISFKSPISMYNKIAADDFEVIANFKERGTSSIPVMLKYAPDFLKDVSLKQQTVAFVLKL